MNLYKVGDKFTLNGRLYRVTAIDEGVQALCIWTKGSPSYWLTPEQLDARYLASGVLQPGDILVRGDGLQMTITDSTPFNYMARVFGQELVMSIEQINSWHLNDLAVAAMRARIQQVLKAVAIQAEVTLGSEEIELAITQPTDMDVCKNRLAGQGLHGATVKRGEPQTLVVDYPISWITAALKAAEPAEPAAPVAAPVVELPADDQPVDPEQVKRVLSDLTDAFTGKSKPQPPASAPLSSWRGVGGEAHPALDGLQQTLHMRVAELEAQNAALIEELADRIAASAPLAVSREHAVVFDCSAAELDRRHREGWTVQHMQFNDGKLSVVFYRGDLAARAPVERPISIRAVGPQITYHPRVDQRVAERMAAADARVLEVVDAIAG